MSTEQVGGRTIKPVTQTRFGWPEGDCLMACVASILEVPLDKLPDLYQRCHVNDGNWWTILREHVARFGWEAMYVGQTYLGVGKSTRTPADLAPQGYAIAGGDSPREDVVDDEGENAGHAVVAKDGKLVHDPHPSGDFLKGPVEDWIILLPPADPHQGGDRE